MIGPCLGGRIRTIRSKRRRLAKRRILKPQASIDLVRGNMQETECFGFSRSEAGMKLPRCLKQTERSEHVCLHERLGAVNGSVNVALGGKVNHCIRFVFTKNS